MNITQRRSSLFKGALYCDSYDVKHFSMELKLQVFPSIQHNIETQLKIITDTSNHTYACSDVSTLTPNGYAHGTIPM